MTLEQAKEFYQAYDGRTFHMGREEPGRYHQLMAMNLSEETYRAWDCEILDAHFDRLWTDRESVWCEFTGIVDKLRNMKGDNTRYLKRLLIEMNKMADLNEQNRILIVKAMAGSDAKQNTAGCLLFSGKKELIPIMEKVMENILAKGAENTPQEFEQIGESYLTVLRRVK